MKGLRTRLIVGVLGATVVVATLAAVLGFIWQSDQLREQQSIWLMLQGEQQARVLVTASENMWPDLLSQSPKADGVEFTLVGPQSERHSTGGAELAAAAGLDTKNLSAGYYHAVIELGGERWLALVASVPTQHMYDDLYTNSFSGLMWLLFLVVLAISLTMLFYRRLVVYPVERLKELVGLGDATGLSQFSETQRGDFGFLSRGIIAMNQKMADDSQELSSRLNDLTQAQGQLVRAERLAVVGQLAAGVAHEVGNPLAVVSGYVEMMEAGDLEGAQRDRALESMARELDRMNRTIRDLLDFSRNEDSICGTASVLDAIAHVERLMRAQSRWRQVEFDFIMPPASVHVAMTSDKLVQILLNLCLNSCVAMAGAGKLSLSWEQVDSCIEIYVDDSGPGVPEELRREIFEPFFTTREAGEGTGLGLSVCESILHSVDGTIGVETSPLEGARFVISLAGQGLEDSQ